MTGPQDFDEAYYLEKYSDVAEALVAGSFKSGLEHFKKFGSKELRNPNPFIDVQFYLESNPDVFAAFQNGAISSPFEHYQSFGGAEGRKPSSNFVEIADFDFSQYLSANSDLAAAGITSQKQAYLHYIQFGIAEDRGAKSNSGLVLKNGTPQPTKAPTPTFVGGGGGVDPDQTLTGTALPDTLTGGTGNDTITGGTGADLLTGGGGTDTFVQNNGDSVIWTDNDTDPAPLPRGLPLPLVAGDNIEFINSVDVITDFTGGLGGDLIDVATGNNLNAINAGSLSANIFPGFNILIRGAWNSGTKIFIQSDVGTDALVHYNAQAGNVFSSSNDNWIVIPGAGPTLTADNFI